MQETMQAIFREKLRKFFVFFVKLQLFQSLVTAAAFYAATQSRTHAKFFFESRFTQP
jgi:hypothetical protein